MNLIISAMKEELITTLNALKPTAIGKYSQIELYQKGNWLFAISKIGLVNAAMTLTILLKDYAIKTVYNIGTVGTLKATFKPLSVLVITEAYYTFADAQEFGYTMGQIPGELPSYYSDKKLVTTITSKIPNIQPAVLGSSDIFIDKLEYFNHINTKFKNKIDVVDMEGCAFFQVSLKYQIPIVSIKIITDYLQATKKSSTTQFKQNLSQAGILISDLILTKLFNNKE
ncbi:5'-methylthioadenosine/S-adenosylhomocysteine nucleosidase [Spiroplasma melliferum]|uniref:adenosylhomocysteine nucleosidase n=2 Tax=Spiroplasma melliferum TaxID=2134 RepID=A0AAI9T2Y9_SPIME|nr:5'-methylthioadenosine/S-adenosylhomocysteine nucleosidase [Spiroplasma melliferum]ELL44108.1 5'-methylthioadenosine/S-adenosylhomocysteine nucleosidase [Spiroplasma melliferum IPMB4A]KAI92487.1 MTA/SAH nucleosidase [Spiroplasma melliferum KC3]QCO23946.1 5'-methylthioadenosine nucleosidase/S-adenosylhomocysteine nucleosidase [Spiroplasma melliferum]